MKHTLESAQWIWCSTDPKADEYGEFVDTFHYREGKVILQISADSNYTVFINGVLAAWGQYADFPHDKVYDEVDVTEYCREGENRMATLVWYYGIETSQTYCRGNAGVLYVLIGEKEILCRSDESTLARMSRTYQNHRGHMISSQLGLGYGYDAVKEDAWLTGELDGFSPAVGVDQTLPLRIRPCDRLTLLPEVKGVECKRISDTDVVYDLGREQVGWLSLKLTSPCEQELRIAYGEHLADGCVRWKIGNRDFSVVYRAKAGENKFCNTFRRLGCRYLEVFSQQPVAVEKMAIVPTMYVLEEKERPPLSGQQNRIYDLCVESLHLCMHEHYEDCPWREQALYAMDSRNQMLCGYYAFGEYRFPRANLQLISKDRRDDGLLSICYPMKVDFVIPSFSLHYITECREYLEYSGDAEFLREVYPKLTAIAEAFKSHMRDGLVMPLEGQRYWNFYEWREELDGYGTDTSVPDVVLNALLSQAFQHLAAIGRALGIKNSYQSQAAALNDRIYRTFWNPEKGLCINRPGSENSSQLGNALAVLCGAVSSEEAKILCERIRTDSHITPISLSMMCFKFDAWLKADRKRYAPIILEEIEEIYVPMLEAGSTTVWETELGESDFDNAGSLCHGWSAMPIYYYHILMG